MKILYLLLFVGMLASCELENPIYSRKVRNYAIDIGLMPDIADVFLYCQTNFDESDYTYVNNNNIIFASAYITDGYDFYDPSLISVNNELLDNFSWDEYVVGQYTGCTLFPVQSPHIINWKILGWDGVDYLGTQTLSNQIIINSPSYLDSVSKSAGISILYDGDHNLDSIYIHIKPAYSENHGILGGNPSGTGYDINLQYQDNGSIYIPASALAALPANFYYEINLLDILTEEETYSNRIIFKRSDYTATRRIFLKE